MTPAPIDTNDTLFFSSRSFVSATACVRIGRESITAEYWLEGNISFIWSYNLDISPIYGFSEEMRNNSTVAKAVSSARESLIV
jgi:hypothetical protein